MGHNKVLSTVLAVFALVAFQGDQVSHAIDAYKPAKIHIHVASAHAGTPSFAAQSVTRSHFEAQGHPCEDLGHSEADCPLANIVDGFDITGINDLSAPVQALKLGATKHLLIPNEVEQNRQIRGPPVYLV